MNPARSFFLVLAVIATCTASALPYFQDRVLGYHGLFVGVAMGPMVYVGLIGLCFWISQGNKNVWWLAVLGPVCLGPLLLTLYSFVCWKLRGFAP